MLQVRFFFWGLLGRFGVFVRAMVSGLFSVRDAS